MKKLKTIELFSGMKSFSKMAHSMGHSTFTVDILCETNPNLCADISHLTYHDLPVGIDVLWASPPCECFSVASIGKHWDGGNKAYKPKSTKCWNAMYVLRKTVKLIAEINPVVWIIENPRGVMRKVIEDIFSDNNMIFNRYTVTYCQYGDTRMKPTDIWSNMILNLKPPCKNGSPCHIPAPRGSKTGTQGIMGYLNRSSVPKELCKEIIKQCETNLSVA